MRCLDWQHRGFSHKAVSALPGAKACRGPCIKTCGQLGSLEIRGERHQSAWGHQLLEILAAANQFNFEHPSTDSTEKQIHSIAKAMRNAEPRACDTRKTLKSTPSRPSPLTLALRPSPATFVLLSLRPSPITLYPSPSPFSSSPSPRPSPFAHRPLSFAHRPSPGARHLPAAKLARRNLLSGALPSLGSPSANEPKLDTSCSARAAGKRPAGNGVSATAAASLKCAQNARGQQPLFLRPSSFNISPPHSPCVRRPSPFGLRPSPFARRPSPFPYRPSL